MWAVMSFLLAAAIGLVAVLAVGRRGSAQSDHYPWILYDTAKLHVGIMAGLAGFAFTGIVLVVTLARDRPGIGGSSLDTVIVMFLVAYLWWVGNAFLISSTYRTTRRAASWCRGSISALPRRSNIAQSFYPGSRCCRSSRRMNSVASRTFSTFFCPHLYFSDPCSSQWLPMAWVSCGFGKRIFRQP